jgi:peptidoglycan/LPS O-acetylase OafA/YrhL
MPLPGHSAGHGRRPQWPLAAAWALSVASLLVIALLARPAAHTYGEFLLAGSTGSLIVVLAYARLPRRGMTPPRTVLLVGGP